MMVGRDVERAHEQSYHNRAVVLASRQCGCFFCGSIFRPRDITGWSDGRPATGETALCPRCGIDSVIGDASGAPITNAFLNAMARRWFAGSVEARLGTAPR